MDIDAAGGAATAGLMGGAIEKPTGEAGEHANVCTDCGQATTGKFCSNCGQPTHVHRSLLHLGEEMLHGVLHFDARIWRTLPLLAINPGRLTREWVQGRRTRYVSPLAMFLFTVFLMFFAFSFMGGGKAEPQAGADQPSLSQRITEAEERAAGAREGLAQLEAQTGPARSEVAIRAVRATLAGLETRVADLKSGTVDAPRTDGLEDGTWQANLRDKVTSGQIDMGHSYLGKKIEKKLLNPDLALYKLQQTTYKFSFLLIPLSIPFVALLFLWRRGFTLYDHGVFVLYSLTAMSILFLAAALLTPVWGGFGWIFAGLIIFGIPAHMFAQLKGAYGLSWFSAAWRTFFLINFSLIALSMFFTTIIALGLTG